MSPETRKKVAPVCFGEGRVRDGVEDDVVNLLIKFWLKIASCTHGERSPDFTNSGEQLARLGRGKSSRRRGLRTRGERGSRGAFYRAWGGLELGGARCVNGGCFSAS